MDAYLYFLYLLIVIPLFILAKFQYKYYKNKKLLDKLKHYETEIRKFYLGDINNYVKVTQALKGQEYSNRREINNILTELLVLNRDDISFLK